MKFSLCQAHIFYKTLEVELDSEQVGSVFLWQQLTAVSSGAVLQASLLQLPLYRL
jgi:hypothetical protein